MFNVLPSHSGHNWDRGSTQNWRLLDILTALSTRKSAVTLGVQREWRKISLLKVVSDQITWHSISLYRSVFSRGLSFSLLFSLLTLWFWMSTVITHAIRAPWWFLLAVSLPATRPDCGEVVLAVVTRLSPAQPRPVPARPCRCQAGPRVEEQQQPWSQQASQSSPELELGLTSHHQLSLPSCHYPAVTASCLQPMPC